MKKCTWCGKKYSDDTDICTLDASPLVTVTAPPPTSEQNQANPVNPPSAPIATWKKINVRIKGKYAIAGIAVLILGISIFFLNYMGMLKTTAAESPRTRTENSGYSRKSKEDLLKDYAKSIHGDSAYIEIQGGFAGDSYQVIVEVPITSGDSAGGYNRYSYSATVDAEAQRVTSWNLYDHN
jgi:hypothetical protein